MKLVKKYNQDNVQSLEAYAACFCDTACPKCYCTDINTLRNISFNQSVSGPFAISSNNNGVNILKYCM